MKIKIIALFAILSITVRAQSNFSSDSLGTYIEYLQQHKQSPVDYIVSKFDVHDIIIIGECHQKKEYCELISELIKSAKINYFATEFVKSSNTDIINKIVTSPEFDRNKAIDVLRDYTWPIWGFEEYLSTIRSVWQVNSTIANQKDKIKIIGLDSEWSQYENMCTDKKPSSVLFKQNVEREENMIRAVKENYSRGKKVLVQIGFAHTLYKFKSRFAAELFTDYKDKVFQICLHQQFEGNATKMTISKDIEKIMAANKNKSIGFDVFHSPFAKLSDPSCYYFNSPQHRELEDIAMGYIFIKPYSQLSIVTWIPDFVNEKNFEKAKCVSLKMRFIKSEPRSIDGFNQLMSQHFNGK